MPTSSANDLHLVPLGAGDLIDRAVRLYRRHLLTLMRIAAPPVVVTAIGWVMCTVAIRGVSSTSDVAAIIFYVLLIIAGIGVIIGGHIFSLIVMGGASRNLVTHLLWNEPVLVRTTYAAVRSRFWSLLGATVMVAMWLWISLMVGFFGGYMIGLIVAGVLVFLAHWLPDWLTIFAAVIGSGVGIGV